LSKPGAGPARIRTPGPLAGGRKEKEICGS